MKRLLIVILILAGSAVAQSAVPRLSQADCDTNMSEMSHQRRFGTLTKKLNAMQIIELVHLAQQTTWCYGDYKWTPEDSVDILSVSVLEHTMIVERQMNFLNRHVTYRTEFVTEDSKGAR